MNGLLKLLRKWMTNYVPQSIKYAIARKIGNVSFKVREIWNIHFLDKQLLWLFIKLHELEKAEKIISDHNNELDYLRFIEKVERYKAFGDDFNQGRLDYEEEDFKRILKVNQDLIQQFPNDFLLHDRMARNYLSGGYRQKAKWHFCQSLKLQRKQNLSEGKTGLIVLISMPRSGTGFSGTALMNGLGLNNLNNQYQFVDAWFPDYGIFTFPDYLAHHNFSPMPDGFVDGHAAALESNLWNLPLITDKLIVNFRDPRQAIISWVHYMEYLRFSGNIGGLMEYQLPDGYFKWSLDQQLDWQIENYFVPVNIEWIKGWLQADEDPEFPCKIHFSIFEVLAQDPKRYFQQILTFFNLPENKFTYPQKPTFKPKTHLRKGKIDEWKDVLNNEQIQKINNLIPEEWFERFNWEK
jgi:hypothetical protein